MARRMSNRNRIDRMREEAQLTEREKKAKAPADTGRGKDAGRMKIVWGIKNSEGEIIAAFPYPEKGRAEAEAERLRKNGQRGCLVCPHKVPF